MRPEILFPLFQDASTLAGVGQRTAKALEKRTGRRLLDMCWLLPQGLIDRSHRPPVGMLRPGDIATLEVQVSGHSPPGHRSRPYVVHCFDKTGEIDLVFFHMQARYLLERLPVGKTRFVSGSVDFYRNRAQMHHPAYIVEPEALEQLPLLEPIYPSALGVGPRVLRKAIASALEKAPELPEWLDEDRLQSHRWRDWRGALLSVHAPQNLAELEPDAPARKRLAYDELLANQLALGVIRAHHRKRLGRALTGGAELKKRTLESLPWNLTAAQQRVLHEIEADMKSPYPMLRLLQGDVGSGKTIVAFLSMLGAVGSGAQAAFMAPTELLARQHYAALEPWCEHLGLRLDLLVGQGKAAGRSKVLAALESGETQILVGTHALFQEQVKFADLGMIVIDEQHRFGVHQKLQLSEKAEVEVDTLVMTATPIPRTLTMTVYGYMEVSRLDESPPGRKPVTTVVMPFSRLEDLAGRLRSAIAGGARAFWVCPLITEVEGGEDDEPRRKKSAAVERHEWLRERFGERVGLVHGRMKSQEKDSVMSAFACGDLDILVATTVIEVGIDVPEASVMVVEEAEMFGLAQLHQLRGRVGRGTAESSCILLYRPPLSDMASRRLRLMRETEDGFRIAEEDLRLRGSGELLGTRQSGLPEFRLAHPYSHASLLEEARANAETILKENPSLEGERGKALRILLYLFGRDEVVGYFRSG